MSKSDIWHREPSRHQRYKNQAPVAEMQTLRRIVGETVLDRIWNENIREQCGGGRQRKTFWRDHMQRMDDGSQARAALRRRLRGTQPPAQTVEGIMAAIFLRN